MAGFQLPITIYTPQQLAQMAQAAFRAPALNFGGGGGGGGMGGGGAAAPGFDAQAAAGAAQGVGALGARLFNGPGIDERTRASDAEIANWSSYGSQGQMLGPSNASYGDLGGGGGTYGLTSGGGMADGGPVMPGQYYTVGERGPETFVPAVPGFIVPNEVPPDPRIISVMPDYPQFPDPRIGRGSRDDPYYPRGRDEPYYPPAGREAGRDFFGGWSKTRR